MKESRASFRHKYSYECLWCLRVGDIIGVAAILEYSTDITTYVCVRVRVCVCVCVCVHALVFELQGVFVPAYIRAYACVNSNKPLCACMHM